MPDEPAFEIVNTPETLGATPRYVLSQNAISRSIYNLSATAQKLTAMAMALLPLDLSSLNAAFSYPSFCKALGISAGGESFKVFRSAVKECMKNTISIERISETGDKIWEEYTWFAVSSFNERTGVCTMKFSSELAGVLAEFKRLYTKIPLPNLGRLQSKYALRIYELAMSYSSLAGKNGNKAGEWYFERDIIDLRRLLGVPDDVYRENKFLRKFAIEDPIEELNAAGIGIAIKTESVKQGRRLAAVRFICKIVPKMLSATRGKRKKADIAALQLPKPNPKIVEDREDKELEHLAELYPKEFAALYEEELAKPTFLPADSLFRQNAAKFSALARLREKYGIVK